MPAKSVHRSGLPADISLDEHRQAAVSRLLCLLGNGEDAAALSFTALARDARSDHAPAALAMIAREEEMHGAWVEAAARLLPKPVRARPVIQASRRLHFAIGQGSVGERLAGVTALDSAACILFSALLRPGAPLAKTGRIAKLLHRIHRDEARHVAIASGLAVAEGASMRLCNRAIDIRAQFAGVLELVADDFEALEVDSGALFKAIREFRTGLFAS